MLWDSFKRSNAKSLDSWFKRQVDNTCVISDVKSDFLNIEMENNNWYNHPIDQFAIDQPTKQLTDQPTNRQIKWDVESSVRN